VVEAPIEGKEAMDPTKKAFAGCPAAVITEYVFNQQRDSKLTFSTLRKAQGEPVVEVSGSSACGGIELTGSPIRDTIVE
jgi:hypothetical protein